MFKAYYKAHLYNIEKNCANIIWINLSNMLEKQVKYDEYMENSIEDIKIEKKYEQGMFLGTYHYYIGLCEMEKAIKDNTLNSKKLACCKKKLQQAYWIVKVVDDITTMQLAKKYLE